jgi:hypothetical protein
VLALEAVEMNKSITRRCSGGKMVKVAVKVSNGTIEWAQITGDFFIHPEWVIDSLEEKLVGAAASQVADAVHGVLREGIFIIGFNPEELILMIEECSR